MRFGMIGAGAVAQAISGHLVAAGHPVTLAGRHGPVGLQDTIARLGPLATAGSVAEAAVADMVFLAVMWPDIRQALSGLPDWNGRILVDTTSQLEPDDDQLTIVDAKSLVMATGSEAVASRRPWVRSSAMTWPPPPRSIG